MELSNGMAWFKTISNDSSLEQGDIIENLKILNPSVDDYRFLNELEDEEESIRPVNYISGDFIILSQSCDLENGKVESVILCPLVPLSKICNEIDTSLKSSSQREQLRQGNLPAFHLLEKIKLCASDCEDYYCVYYRHLYSVPKSYLVSVVNDKKRLRLLSPYKEHLSQSFARFFMRVGLPSSIPKEDMANYKSKTEKNN